MTTKDGYDFFLSYNRNDPAWRWVGDIAEVLTIDEFTVFFDDQSLADAPGADLDLHLREALTASRVVLVCVGAGGLGPTQRNEVAFVRTLEANDPEGTTVVPLLLDGAQHTDIPKDFLEGWLSGKLAVAFPNRPGFQPLDYVTLKMRDTDEGQSIDLSPPKQAPPAEEPAGSKVERALKILSRKAPSNGLAVVLGSSWRESGSRGTFDPGELSSEMLKGIGIKTTQTVPVEQAAAAFSFIKNVNDYEGDDLRTSLREKMALAAPPVIDEIAHTFKHLSTRPIEEVKPLIVASLNMDALLERALLDNGVSFLRIVARPSGDFQYTVFSASVNDRGIIGVEPVPDHPEFNAALRERIADNVGQAFSTLSTSVFSKEAMTNPTQRFRNLKSGLDDTFFDSIPGNNHNTLLRRMADLDDIICAHCESHQIKLPPGAFDPKNDENIRQKANLCRKIQDEYFRLGIPVVLKLYGCVHSEQRFPFSLDNLVTSTRNRLWFPEGLTERIANLPAVFAGFNVSSVDFHHLFFGHMFKGLKNNIGPPRHMLTHRIHDGLAAEEGENEEEPIHDLLERAIIQRIENGDDIALLSEVGVELVNGVSPQDFLRKLRVEIGALRPNG